MNRILEKYWLAALGASFTFMAPMWEVFFFVGGLVIADFVTGVIKAAKTNTVSSHRMIDKFYTSIGYFIGLLITRAVEIYFKIDFIPLIQAVTAIIAISEIQSIRENIKTISNVDILKPVLNMFKRKQNESDSNN